MRRKQSGSREAAKLALLVLAFLVWPRTGGAILAGWSWYGFCAPFYSYAWLFGVDGHWPWPGPWGDVVTQCNHSFSVAICFVSGCVVWFVATAFLIALIGDTVLFAIGRKFEPCGNTPSGDGWDTWQGFPK